MSNPWQQQPQQPQQPQYGPPPNYNQQAPAKSKVLAGILGIILGTLGIHNFYLGHYGKGLAQLFISLVSFGLLSWVSGIWGFIEGILILTASPSSKWCYDARGIMLV